MNLKQGMSEEEILVGIGRMHVSLQLAEQNLRSLILENEKLEKEVYKLKEEIKKLKGEA